MQLLLRVAETGSMTRAAGQLDLTPAAVSAAVQRIEAALDLRLFERTTRTLHPTDEGLIVLEGCRETVHRWLRTLDEARGSQATLEGSLRVSAPADTVHQIVGAAVAEFCALHPGLRVVVHPTDTLQNVLEDALDLSIRYGALPDSTLVARKLATSPRILVAAPQYLAQRGTPTRLEDLTEHRLLTLQLGNSPERSWTFRSDSGPVEIPVESPMCGDGLLVRRWAVQGHGIAFKGLLDVVDDLESGRLVRVCPAVDGGFGGVYAVHPSRAFVPARVRALVDHLAGVFARREGRCGRWAGEQGLVPDLPWTGHG